MLVEDYETGWPYKLYILIMIILYNSGLKYFVICLRSQNQEEK